MPDRRFLPIEDEMPKQKTKSGAKKRFRLTATGKIKFGPAGKRHGMTKRSSRMLRTACGPETMCESDRKIVLKYMPYAR